MNFRYSLILILLTIGTSTFAQIDGYFERISSNSGLSQNSVTSIFQDKDGFLWFGTNEGLNKYNGYTFETYKPDKTNSHSLAGILISKVRGDEEGNLWVGTTGNGISYFDRNKNRFYNFNNEGNQYSSQPSEYILDIFCDTKGKIWVSSGAGIKIFNFDRQFHTLSEDKLLTQKIAFQLENGELVFKIKEDRMGNVWLGTKQGLIKVVPISNEKVLVERIKQFNYQVISIDFDSLNNMVIGTIHELFFKKRNSYTNTFNTSLELIWDGERINEVRFDKNGNIWAASYNGLGFLKLNKKTNTYEVEKIYRSTLENPNSLSTNLLLSIYIDKTGVVWLGTDGLGINKLDPDRKLFEHFKKKPSKGSISHNIIRVIYEDSNGTLWMGTKGGGLNFQLKEEDNQEYNNFRCISLIQNPVSINEIAFEGKKTLEIGTSNGNGLYQIDITVPSISPIVKKSTKIKGSIFKIFQDNLGQVWYGSYRKGLYKQSSLISEKMRQFTSKDGLSNTVRNIIQDNKGDLWIGTSNGLFRLKYDELKKDNPFFEAFKSIKNDSTSLSQNYILSFLENTKGDLWVGTFGGGINKVNNDIKTGKVSFSVYDESSGLPNNVIKGILEDNNDNLWISTNKGISKFNPHNESFKNYDINDGLQENEFQELTCFQRANGEMLFGGINGFNSFLPNNIKNNRVPPTLQITSMSIWNKEVKNNEEFNGRVIIENDIAITDKVNLKHYENSISFEFAALHYNSPNKNKYAYRLIGFEKNWVYTNSDRRIASYTNLPPGKYVFEVKASNNDGLWNEHGKKISITIFPPIWETWYANIVYCLLAIGLILGFRKYTIIKTQKKHELMLDHMERERAEEVYHMKIQFFTNISHEFRTPLSLIQGPLEYLEKNEEFLSSKDRKLQYNLIKKSTTQLKRFVNQVLHFRKVDLGKKKLEYTQKDIISFINEVISPFYFLAKKRNIEFIFESDLSEYITCFSPDTIEKILNNLLSNAFKYTPNEGVITITLKKEKRLIRKFDFLKKNKQSDNVLEFCISDSGVGIDEKIAKNIFDNFFNDDTRKERGEKGVGIGLAFTKSLVELHHGVIQLNKQHKKGASFVFTIPVDIQFYQEDIYYSDLEFVENDDYPYSLVAVENFLEQPQISNSNKKGLVYEEKPRILIVEDNNDLRCFIKEGLKNQFTILEAENGEIAISIIQEYSPSIIISDMLMPIMNGMELAQKIKQSKIYNHIPFIFLTAKSDEITRVNALKTGVDDYITKPFSLEILQLKINNILKYKKVLHDSFRKELTLKPKEVEVASADERFLEEVMQIIERNMMDSEFNVNAMAQATGLSRSNLYSKLKELTGFSTGDFIRNIRLKRAYQLLETTDLTIKEVMFMSGFNTASYFSKCFKNQFGKLPSDYKNSSIIPPENSK